MGVAFVWMEAVSGAFFAAIWAASVIWASRDAMRRCSDVSLRIASVALALFVPVVGAGLYALARPCEEAFERRARRLRIRVLEQALEEQDAERCVACGEPLEPEFRCCPSCGERAKVECRDCGELLHPAWAACPWCAARVEIEPEPAVDGAVVARRVA